MPTVTRFPPSPTGDLHVGGARTALFNWLYAEKTGGKMVLRIEDTDRERSTQAAVDGILEALEWLGLGSTQAGDIYYQSCRRKQYDAAVRTLLDEGRAYYCFCDKARLESVRETQRAGGQKPRYDRRCRDLARTPIASESAVVRFKNPQEGEALYPPQGNVVFYDMVHGMVAINSDELDDLVIARSDGSPTYHLCVVADDILMDVTHIIRGDDHINNTPRQLNILHALGEEDPVYAHVPMILGADGRRLSKRHGATNVLEYRDLGILPEALLNYLARLGWSHGDREIFSREELVELFDITDINSSAARFDYEKLLWFNQHYLRLAKKQRLADELRARLQKRDIDTAAGPPLKKVVKVMRERVHTLEEMAEKVVYLYADFDDYEPAAAKKFLTPAAAGPLSALHKQLAAVDKWKKGAIKDAMARTLEAESLKMGAIAQPLRVAISGGAVSPSIEVTAKLVGRERTLERIARAIRRCESGGNE